MKVKLICVGNRMPGWVNDGAEDFAKRIRSELGYSLIEIPLAKRGKSISIEQCLAKEASAILDKVDPSDYVVVFDVKGKAVSTEYLADQLEQYRLDGRDLCLIIGGPDGLHSSIMQRADVRWSLSAMVLPHGLVRVLVVEQLYRALSIIQGHPYHRP